MSAKLITRSQAADYLHSLDSSKSAAQWYSFLNDNGRKDPSRGSAKRFVYKIPTTKDLHGTILYSCSDLDQYIKKLNESRSEKAAKQEESRADQIKKAFGMDESQNHNAYGQYFGYKWDGAIISAITDNQDKGKDAAAIQMIIHNPLRASALSLRQAKELAQELIDAISCLDKSYNPKATHQTVQRREMIL
ncbi:hypothetical protein ABTA49_12780 [Acinetobacter baumannii]|uniref:hypothetical protein n=1 Tax=Acinetobacter baumannii TaxID=470 RepID=UPI0013D1AD7A|nr:hypothetical protein [Acinetobacter baumannii]EHU2483436.1 hypothetical protein [Acinetobacter baumannii]MDV7434305.1 hypothetical protein [Acinetobacter baumannii]